VHLITGGLRNTALDTLEYHANLIPTDLHLNTNLLCQASCLFSAPKTHPLFAEIKKSRRTVKSFHTPLMDIATKYPALCSGTETISHTAVSQKWTPQVTILIEETREQAIEAAERCHK
jgi:hypothetical protein